MVKLNDLLYEIFKEKEIIHHWFYSSFRNNQDEKEFSAFKIQYYNKIRLYLGILICCFLVISILLSNIFSDKFKLYDAILKGLILIINIVSLIIILKTDVYSSVNIVMCYIKFICNLMNYTYILIYFLRLNIVQNVNLDNVNVIRFIYTALSLTLAEYSFFIRPSKLFSNIIVSIYLITVIIGSVLCENDRIYLLPECLLILSLYFVFQFSEGMWNFKREIFVSIKQIETISEYYESLINNMQIQVVSLMDNKVIMYNSSFLKEISLFEYGNLRSKNENLSITNSSRHDLCDVYLNDLVRKDSSDTICKIIKEIDKEKQNSITSISNFKSLGNFVLKSNNKRVFAIYFRIFSINKDLLDSKAIIDVYINEITDIMAAEQLCSETKIKQKLFSKFAHEFKTPVIIIKSLLGDILNKIIDNSPLSEIRELSNHTNHLSDYIQFLINDIIYYSNEESISIHINEVNFEEIVEFSYGVVKSLLCVMPGNKTKINCKYFYDKQLNHFIIKSDKTRLIQIMLNLISNSVKFTRSGEITIGAELKRSSTSNIYYTQLYVKDTGIGLKLDDLAKITNNEDNIIKINIDNSYNEMGTGLGLSIIKNLITKLGHRLEIISTFGEGSDFNIIIDNNIKRDTWSENSSNIGTICNHSKFPSLRSSFDDNIFNSLSPKKCVKSPSHIYCPTVDISVLYEKGIKRILVCDDSNTLRKSVKNLILSNKEISSLYEVIECYDGADMLIKIIEDQGNNLIEIIITDENMEYMCGSTAICILREWEILRKIKKVYIISLTAFVDEFTLSNIKQKGADIVINKPLSQSILSDLYINLIKNK